ncbi:hypothetical protein FGG08_006637 [Glutinoglossum americanum]|uniref:Serine protease n=1 Tax=Glutinoglossum americanum TaxID=1670608 RepID=A0A9P8KX92_9PEZI|nr:hypothetical protein FGG08_006637 [Glutinoglossum americanum]
MGRVGSTETALIAEAIKTAAIVNQMADTIAARWDLKDTDSEAPEEAAFFPYSNGHDESIVDLDDSRTLVPKKEYSHNDSKFRSVVKLFLRYEKQKTGDPWAMATGWLIKEDLLVTAGHCAFDWSHKMGRLTHLKAYIGYDGKGSIGDESVQFRKGKRVVTTSEWLTARGDRAHDVAFIQLQKPFVGITPIKFGDTPESGEPVLGVVGYPGDKRDEETDESGAKMYQMFLKTPYNLQQSREMMLEYEIDTFGGNSGSPVFRKSDMVSIGVHVYGGDVNSASVIGIYGNVFEDYIAAFNTAPTKGPAVGSIPGLSFIRVTPSRAKALPGTIANGEVANGHLKAHRVSTGESTLEDDEGFLGDVAHTIKVGLRVGTPILGNILQAGLPIAFGPIGAPIGALAGIALRAAGKAAESEVAGESFSIDTIQADGLVERAILGEAALAGVMSMSKTALEEEGVFSKMTDFIKKSSPTVKVVAPKVMGVVMEPALRIALEALSEQGNPATTESGSAHLPREQGFHAVLASASLGRRVDPDTKAFVEALLESSPDTESIWSSLLRTGASLGSLIVKGTIPAGPVSTIVNAGLSALARSASEADIGGEVDSTTTSLDGLHQRAMLGEAALQALMLVPVERLKEENIFDKMKVFIREHASGIIKSAPGIIRNVLPLVTSLLAADPESTLHAPQKPPGHKVPKGGIRNGPDDFLGLVDDWAKKGISVR